MNANDRPDVRTLGRVDALLQQMTLEEKAALCVGRDMWTTEPVSRLGIPSVWVADGPTGLRKATSSTDVGLGTSVPATCFPTESALAATWDINLVAEVGRTLGAECRSNGVQVLLGPGVNLKRSPLCGRNFEYFSEDPVLSGEMAAAFIRGVQEQGVGTSLKHFVANEQETDRLSVDSVVDERSLRELYLRPFEIAVAEARPWTIMCAYNRVNGTYCAENEYLLRTILQEEWGFDGIVVSDWGAVTDRAAGIEAGMHLQMPGVPSARSVVEAVRNGSLPEARLDAIVRALLRFLIKSEVEWRPAGAVRLEEHHAFARRVAADSIVLLKNDGNLLPLGGDALSKVAVIGAFAKAPRYQGAGSSQVVPTRLETLYEELARAVGPSGVLTFAPGYGAAEAPDARLLDEARRAASSANVAVVVVGLPASYEEEGVDRRHIELPPSHNAVVEAVLSAQQYAEVRARRTVLRIAPVVFMATSTVSRSASLCGRFRIGMAGVAAMFPQTFVKNFTSLARRQHNYVRTIRIGCGRIWGGPRLFFLVSFFEWVYTQPGFGSLTGPGRGAGGPKYVILAKRSQFFGVLANLD